MYMNPMDSLDVHDTERIRSISRGWWVLLLVGLFTMVAGFILLNSLWTLGSLAAFFGIIFIVRGLFQLFSISGHRPGMRNWNLLVGILNILVGLAALIIPVRTLLFVATFIGIWLVVIGLFDIVGSLTTRHVYPYWWLALIRGLVAVPLGIWALGRPFQTLVVLVAAIGIWTVIAGLTEVVMAFEIRRLPHLLEWHERKTQPGTA